MQYYIIPFITEQEENKTKLENTQYLASSKIAQITAVINKFSKLEGVLYDTTNITPCKSRAFLIQYFALPQQPFQRLLNRLCRIERIPYLEAPCQMYSPSGSKESSDISSNFFFFLICHLRLSLIVQQNTSSNPSPVPVCLLNFSLRSIHRCIIYLNMCPSLTYVLFDKHGFHSPLGLLYSMLNCLSDFRIFSNSSPSVL